jgi:hypothetical protein
LIDTALITFLWAEARPSADDHRAFHDVTIGTNTVRFLAQTIVGYKAPSDWDPVTGWGSPDAKALVPMLVRDSSQ